MARRPGSNKSQVVNSASEHPRSIGSPCYDVVFRSLTTGISSPLQPATYGLLESFWTLQAGRVSSASLTGSAPGTPERPVGGRTPRGPEAPPRRSGRCGPCSPSSPVDAGLAGFGSAFPLRRCTIDRSHRRELQSLCRRSLCSRCHAGHVTNCYDRLLAAALPDC
jgi:hypothetical protein